MNALKEHYKAVRARLRNPPKPPVAVVLLPEHMATKESTVSAMGAPELRDIVQRVAERHGISVATLCMRSRRKDLVRFRHEAMWEGYQCGYSNHRIGMALGGLDHTTVIYGVRLYQRILDAVAVTL